MLGEATHVLGAGKSLYLPIDFILNLKLLYKTKFFLKKKAIGSFPL